MAAAASLASKVVSAPLQAASAASPPVAKSDFFERHSKLPVEPAVLSAWKEYLSKREDVRREAEKFGGCKEKYLVIEPHFDGGSHGEIFRVVDKKTQKVFAMKVNNVAKHSRFDAMLREKVYLATFHSKPNFPQIYDSCAFAPFRLMFVMDFYLAPDLFHLFIQPTSPKIIPLQWNQYVSILRQSIEILSDQKENGVIHGDDKPPNKIFDPATGILTQLDFGIAQRADGELCDCITSLDFRAPEILLGLPYDCSVDTWGAGSTLYELGTGKRLFPPRIKEGDDEDEKEFNLMRVIVQRKKRVPPSHMIQQSMAADFFFGKLPNGEYVVKGPVSADSKESEWSILQDLKNRWSKSKEAASEIPLAADLLEQMVEIDPKKRITPAAARAHPLFRNYCYLKITRGPAWKDKGPSIVRIYCQEAYDKSKEASPLVAFDMAQHEYTHHMMRKAKEDKYVIVMDHNGQIIVRPATIRDGTHLNIK